jgi:hypothetical protein
VRGFLGAVTGYPTVLFTFALVVVVGYWVLVLVGGAHPHGARAGHGGHGHGHGQGHGGGHGQGHGQGHGRGGGGPGHGPGGHDVHGGHHGPGHEGHGGGRGGGRHGHARLTRVLGLAGVPVTVAVSLVVAFAWFTALCGQVWLGDGARWFLLPMALVGGWVGARLLAVPLARLTPEPPPPPSRQDFVGRECVIRTGRVGPDFGQAEVRADDGSAAVVQVRQSLDDAAGPGGTLRSGAAALIYEYDAAGEFFWVMPGPPPTG